MPREADTHTLLAKLAAEPYKGHNYANTLKCGRIIFFSVYPSFQDKKGSGSGKPQFLSAHPPALFSFARFWLKKARRGCRQAAEGTHRFEDCHCVLLEPRWVDNFVVQNGLKEVVLVLRLEGRVAAQHLVQQHTHGPPVNVGAIQHLLQNLKKGWK